MTNNEIYVVIVLALVGYWGTSALLNFFKKENNWTKNQSKGSSNQRNESANSHQSESKSIPSCFDILGVSQSASLDEIKLAYKKKISMYHPDKVSNMGPEFNEIAQKKSKEINAAYDEAIKYK